MSATGAGIMQDCYLANNKGRCSLLNGPIKSEMAIIPDCIAMWSMDHVMYVVSITMSIKYIISN